jgi:hypothetical protein
MKMITVMADFGGSLYAWEKDDSDETTVVGGLVADGGWGFWGGYVVSKELQREFAIWAGEFERESRTSGFRWDRFHEVGVSLARRLKGELGDSVRVVYATPWEDPGADFTLRAEIMRDGSLRHLRMKRPQSVGAP